MQISYVNVFVGDLARATEFYRDKPGLRLEFSAKEHGYASFSAGSVRLGMVSTGPDQAQLVGRHTGVGFDVADLEAEHARPGSVADRARR
jgi:catechol 2,3-dioxygenase-like lactoylglutathione lyase family enzyme